MNRILILLTCFICVFANAQKPRNTADGDLSTTIDQAAFNKITSSMDLPLTLFEHKESFPGLAVDKDNVKDITDSTDRLYSTQETRELFKWAVENSPGAKFRDGESENGYKQGVNQAWMDFKKEVSMIRSQTEQEGRKFQVEGFTPEELKILEEGNVDQIFNLLQTKSSSANFAAKVHLAYAKVELVDRPTFTVNSPDFTAGNVRVKATATGELWIQIPRFKCCRYVLGICVCVKVEWHWIRAASLTVSARVGTDATVTFAAENLKITATARFNRLYLDYNILRDINLASIGNYYLRRMKFELYDVSKFVASIPYIDKNFAIEDIRLPAQSNGVKVEVDVKKIQ
jgi:hypothetical protein